MKNSKLQYMYNGLKGGWAVLPDTPTKPDEESKQTYHGSFMEYVRVFGGKMLAEGTTLASDPDSTNNLSQKLSDAVASGYVTIKDGKFIKVADTPTWVHPDLRVKEG